MMPLRVTMQKSVDGMFAGCTSIQFNAIFFNSNEIQGSDEQKGVFNGILSCTRRKYVIDSTISRNLTPHAAPQYTNNRHFNMRNNLHLPHDLPSKIFDMFKGADKSEFHLL